MDNPTLADFLQRALPWPDPNSETGWVNLHWRAPDRKGITGGQAFKTLEEILGFSHWSTRGKGTPYVADLYYCTSLQREHGEPKKSGRYSALRSADNAVSSKVLYADVDKYESKEAALQAIKDFCERSGSPYPSAIVDSGGGIHAYWFLPEPLQKDDWLGWAAKLDGLMTVNGLKHDNISTDISRILRLPGSFNFKRTGDGSPPQPVVLKLLNGDVDLATWKSLQDATPVAAAHVATNRAPNLSIAVDSFFVDPRLAKSGPSPVFHNKIPIAERVTEGGLYADPILTFCPMFADAHATGGEKVGQPVWHQQALACTFIFGGRELFHDLGRKHPGYSPASSDEMYERKLRDRLHKGLGYPSCAAFEADGAEQCRACPLRGQITSPLKITKDTGKELLGEVSQPPAIEVSDERPILIPGYEYGDPDLGEDPRLIYTVEKRGKETIRKKLFDSQVFGSIPFKDNKTNAMGLRVFCTGHLDSRTGKLRRETVEIDPESFCEPSAAIYADLNNGGCLVNGQPGKAGDLMLTFRNRMALEMEVYRIASYGWIYLDREEGEHQGEPVGFAYDGTVYMEGGRTRPTYSRDEQLQKVYRVGGGPGPWLEALKCIQQMNSPGLETVVLSAFAAPLMIFTGHPSTIVMVRGQSGGSKSTASAVATAVWAHPRGSLLKPSSSKLGIMKRMGSVRHLPIIWDDIRNSMFEVAKDILMEITQGGDGLKLDQHREEREQGTWDNMLVTSSNNSLLEYLEESNKNDGAALVRCFEFSVPPILNGDVGYVNPNYLSPLLAELEYNHGHIGRDYAEVLGAKPAALKVMYREITDRIAQQVEPYQPYERFWMAAVATTLMGAILANDLKAIKDAGLKFDLVRLEKFLLTTYRDLRTRLAEANVQSDTSQFVKKHLGDFINTYAAQRTEVVWTLDKPAKAGKPVMVAPLWPVGDQARNLRQVAVRFIVTECLVRISKNALDAYLRKAGISTDRMHEGMMKYYGAKKIQVRIAAGLPNVAAQAQEAVYEIQIKPGSWLDDILQNHATPDDQQGIVLKPLPQNPGPEALHPLPGQTGPASGKDAS